MRAQKFEVAAQLAAGMAHEINTPVQYIGDNLRFLKDAFTEMLAILRSADRSSDLVQRLSQTADKFDLLYLEEEIPQAIEQALDGVLRVAGLVSAMQEFSPPGQAKKLAINLNHSIQSVLLMARNEWKYVAEMNLDLDPALPPVPCYPGEINQLVYSLIVHVAHFMGGNLRVASELGLITIRTRTLTGSIELHIEHTLAAKSQSPDHEPFFTLESFLNGGPELAMTRSALMESHQGTLDFETNEVQGGKFILRLPCFSPS